jgi:methionyl-tRNA synthetase
MPETAKSINGQLRSELPLIPDTWTADTIEPGHEIGKAAFLFSQIKPEKAGEWRDMFGSDAVRKAKEENESNKAVKKAAMKALKALKLSGKEADA